MDVSHWSAQHEREPDRRRHDRQQQPGGEHRLGVDAAPRRDGDGAEDAGSPRVRAICDLLAPVAHPRLDAEADVEVQVVHGRIGSDDEPTPASDMPMLVGESYDGNRHRFDAAVSLEVSGPSATPCGWCRANEALSSVAELGLVAEPS